jgi:acetyl/propionyl-CoA carboxylase alpha subunit
MNTRLQVEHPVTEMVTGIDLVIEQIRVAAGETISFRQADVRLSGWAMECRITAEDPFNNFMPSLGCVEYVGEPSGPGVRVDSALYPGVELPYHYDPMVAKLITWGRNRKKLARHEARVRVHIVGVETNISSTPDAETSAFAAIFHCVPEKEFSMMPHRDGAGEEVALLAAALLTHLKQRSTPLAPASAGHRSAWRSAGRGAALEGRAGGTGWRRSIS